MKIDTTKIYVIWKPDGRSTLEEIFDGKPTTIDALFNNENFHSVYTTKKEAQKVAKDLIKAQSKNQGGSSQNKAVQSQLPSNYDKRYELFIREVEHISNL